MASMPDIGNLMLRQRMINTATLPKNEISHPKKSSTLFDAHSSQRHAIKEPHNDLNNMKSKRLVMCKTCEKQPTHVKVSSILRKTVLQPITTQCECGGYTVYKGHCLLPGCFTLAEAQRKCGETNTTGANEVSSIEMLNSRQFQCSRITELVNERFGSRQIMEKEPRSAIHDMHEEIQNQRFRRDVERNKFKLLLQRNTNINIDIKKPSIVKPEDINNQNPIELDPNHGNLIEFLNRLHVLLPKDKEVAMQALPLFQNYLLVHHQKDSQSKIIPRMDWFKSLKSVLTTFINIQEVLEESLVTFILLSEIHIDHQKLMIKKNIIEELLRILDRYAGNAEIEMLVLRLLVSFGQDQNSGFNVEHASIKSVIKYMLSILKRHFSPNPLGVSSEYPIIVLFYLSMQPKKNNSLQSLIQDEFQNHAWMYTVLIQINNKRSSLHEAKTRVAVVHFLTFFPNKKDTMFRPIGNQASSSFGSSHSDSNKTPALRAPASLGKGLKTPEPVNKGLKTPPTYIIPSDTDTVSDCTHDFGGRPTYSTADTSPLYEKHLVFKDVYKENETEASSDDIASLFDNDDSPDVIRQKLINVLNRFATIDDYSTLPKLGNVLACLLPQHVSDFATLMPLIRLIVAVCSKDESLVFIFRNETCVTSLIFAMELHPNCLKILQCSGRLLWLITKQNDYGQEIVGNSGGCEALIKSLSANLKSKDLQLDGLAALRSLARNLSNQHKIRKHGFSLVENSIHANNDDPDIVAMAISAMDDFAVDAIPTNNSRHHHVCAFNENTLHFILGVGQRHQNHFYVQKSICLLLKNCAYNDSNRIWLYKNKTAVACVVKHSFKQFPQLQDIKGFRRLFETIEI